MLLAARPQGAYTHRDGIRLAGLYLDCAAAHPVALRLVKTHLHKLLAPWLAEFPDMRDRLVVEWKLGIPALQQLVRGLVCVGVRAAGAQAGVWVCAGHPPKCWARAAAGAYRPPPQRHATHLALAPF